MQQDYLGLAAIVETLSVPILSITIDGTVRSWNLGAEQLFGYSADEIIGKKFNILVPPERTREVGQNLERLFRGEPINQFETVRRRKDGTDVHVSLTIAPVRGPAGEIVGMSVVHHDLTAQKRREDIQNFLADASRLLVVNIDHIETLPKVASLTVTCIADWCVIEVSDGADSLTETAVASRPHEQAELLRELRRLYPADAGNQTLSSRVLMTGKAELVPEVSDRFLEKIAQDAGHLQMLRELDLKSLIVVPLRLRNRSIGTIALGNRASSRRFTSEDLTLVEELAQRTALAIENANLHTSEQSTRQKAEVSYTAERQARAAAGQAIESTGRLESLAAELAEALTPQQVAAVVVAHGVASVGADGGALQLVTDGGKSLEIVAERASDSTLTSGHWLKFSTDLNLPSADALRTREPVFIESESDLESRYPSRDDMPRVPGQPAALRTRAGAHIPLVLSGHPLGVLFLGFTRPRQFSAAQRSFVLGLARQCAQALRRAQLYEEALEGPIRLAQLVERLREGVVSVDRSGRVEFASSNAKRLLSAAPLIEGRPLAETWLGFPLRTFVAGLFGPDVRVVEAQVANADGAHVFDLTGIPPARSDTALLVVTDVSDREHRQRAEREFVANAAHELRTPLAAITSSIERLQAGARDVPERRDRFLGHIQHESARLNRLASSLLVLARAQSREEEPRREEIPLRKLLEEMVDDLEPSSGVALVVDCPPTLLARSNRDLLEHALVNLLTNAVRHTTHGRIAVRAEAGPDGALTIEVSDTGSGIRPEELGRLFDRFYRGSGEEGRAGFGLGLPITKEAVEAVGGRITLTSTPDVGTTARIVLPGAGISTVTA